jgi:hypothetical protein
MNGEANGPPKDFWGKHLPHFDEFFGNKARDNVSHIPAGKQLTNNR